MERHLSRLVDKLKTAHGEKLVSVVLYGSAAVGDHHEKFSDYNVLCVLNDITPREMRSSEEIFRWWRELGNPAPLLVSELEVATSTDCFPIEFHDIQARNRLLYGKDVISSLRIDNSFYRAQVEHELRAKLLRLRQKAAGILSDNDLLRRLLADSVSTFCVLLRHALLLRGASPGLKKREIVAEAERTFGIDPTPFHRILDVREGRIKPKELEPVPALAAYMVEISRVIDAVDQLEK